MVCACGEVGEEQAQWPAGAGAYQGQSMCHYQVEARQVQELLVEEEGRCGRVEGQGRQVSGR